MANQYNSYYLYQQYENRNNQGWIPVYPNVFSVDGGGTMPVSAKTENDPYCGYTGETTLHYLTFKAITDGTFKFVGTSGNTSIQYSLDSGSTWTTLASNADSPTVQRGDNIMWKGYLTPGSSSGNYGIGRFSSTGGFELEGNIMSLLFGDNFSGQTSLEGYDYAFLSLFYYCPYLLSAENLLLPATTLADNCYHTMFCGCANMLKAPQLPATTLAGYCYYSMFMECYSLTAAPDLPATTLAFWCYAQMFSSCYNLTTAPQLPATTLADGCYIHMFNGCSSMTTAPQLPATALRSDCYYSMFNGCSSLITAPEVSATTTANNSCGRMFMGCTSLTTPPTSLPAMDVAPGAYTEMFSGCTSLTTTPQLPATGLSNNCYDNMFCDCSSLVTAPTILPATTLANTCYAAMFWGCTSLTTAPELPASTVPGWAYSYMFKGCTSLNYIKCLATNILSNGTTGWVDGVSSSGTFVKATSMSSWSTGIDGIPSNWTVQND